jgi:hypothetical protein
MNTPHERLTRITFSLPFGEVHALVGGEVNARPLLSPGLKPKQSGFPWRTKRSSACKSIKTTR